jgi:hypothetical protein
MRPTAISAHPPTSTAVTIWLAEAALIPSAPAIHNTPKLAIAKPATAITAALAAAKRFRILLIVYSLVGPADQ